LNCITSLDAFSTCFSLQELYIRKNKISDLVQIGHLQNLSLLKVLFIADNPCCDDKKYRIKTVQYLKGLRKLDNEVICSDELENIKNVNDPEIIRFQEEVTAFLNQHKSIQYNDNVTCPSKDDDHYQNKMLVRNENENGKILRAVKLLLSELSNDDLDTVRSFCDHILEMRK
jgi:Leucine-rich repeat (LRR) protein